MINEKTRVFEIKSEPVFHYKKKSNYFLMFLNCFNVLMLKINLKNLDEFNPIIKKEKERKKKSKHSTLVRLCNLLKRPA